MNKRAPKARQNTVGYHAGLVWTFSFDKPSTERRARLAASAAPAELEEEPDVPYEGPVTLAELRPGAPLTDVIRRLAAANIRGGTRLPGVIVYNHQFYDTLSRLQRVAVVHDGRTVIKTAVLVSLADVGDTDTALQVMEELRRTLIRRYGAPRTFDRGGAHQRPQRGHQHAACHSSLGMADRYGRHPPWFPETGRRPGPHRGPARGRFPTPHRDPLERGAGPIKKRGDLKTKITIQDD